MSSVWQRSQTANINKGPLKAYYDPATQGFNLVSRCGVNPLKSEKPSSQQPSSYRLTTYWTDSEDAISDASSGQSFAQPLNRTSTLKRSICSHHSDIRSHFPISTTTRSPVKQARTDFIADTLSPEKQTVAARVYSPKLVTMGAGIKQHPAYYRRRSIGEMGEEVASILPNTPVLAPVCVVPVPVAFSGPLSCTIPGSPQRRSVETQTTPSTFSQRQSRRRRRSSAAEVISSLKKTFGNIRRAASADRKNVRLSSTPTETSQTPKIKHHRESLCEVNYTLLQCFADRSRLIQMKRPSTLVPFGIFIASDYQGYFISRKGSQDYVAGSEKLLRVGDRVLQVQGVGTKGLDVSTVRGLLQGCHVATLCVKSSKNSRRSSSQSR